MRGRRGVHITPGVWKDKARPDMNPHHGCDFHTIGGRMRRVREELGYSRPKFSDMLRLCENSLKNYERGLRQPSVDTLRRFYQLFNGDVGIKICHYILFGTKKAAFPAVTTADVGIVTILERNLQGCLPVQTNENRALSETIRIIRDDILNQSRPELAKKLGIPSTSIKNYELGDRTVSLEYIHLLCRLANDQIKALDIFLSTQDCPRSSLETLWRS